MGRKSLDADALEVIDKYSGMVYRMAFSMLKNKFDAEDIHQEVFIKYIRKRPKFESEEHERAWFLRVTVNACKNIWKSAWRQKVVGFEEDDLESWTEDAQEQERAEQRAQVISLVKKLPQKYRAVIHLFYYEELSVEEISEVLHTKPSTVRAHLTRARAKLKELMGAERF